MKRVLVVLMALLALVGISGLAVARGKPIDPRGVDLLVGRWRSLELEAMGTDPKLASISNGVSPQFFVIEPSGEMRLFDSQSAQKFG
jgi:hypothetical protein